MRFFIVGKFDSESFASHIQQTLLMQGHQVLTYQHGVRYGHSGKLAHQMNKVKMLLHSATWNTGFNERRIEKDIRTAVTGKGIDYTIVTHDFLRPAEVDLIKKLTNGPVVLWFPDAVVNFGRHMFLNSDFDCCFLKDPFIVDRLQREFPSKKFHYLPECCNPFIHKIYELPAQVDRYACDITIAGNLYANRVVFFEQLSEHPWDIKIWGNPGSRWMKMEKVAHMLKSEYVTGAEKGYAFQMAKIVLNNLHPAEVQSINCRAFEIPALGGFQIVSHRDSIAELFEPGKEIESYRSYDELVDKVRFYLANETARQSIIKKGYERVMAEHTYERRLTVMRNVVNA